MIACNRKEETIKPSRLLHARWLIGFYCRKVDRIHPSECFDYILKSHARYYNAVRTHRSLDQDAPLSHPIQRPGRIASNAVLGGLHHHYVRI